MIRINPVIIAAWAGLGLALFSGGLPTVSAAPSPDAKPAGARVRELQQERVKALEDQLDGLFERLARRKESPGPYLDALRDLGEAELELAEGRAAELAALEKSVRRFRDAEEKIGALKEAGQRTKNWLAQARAARLKVEIQLERRKAAR